MAKLQSQSWISQVRDRLLGELPDENLGVRLAALIYLRWADFQESEQEAIAAFDDTDYKPVLPASLHWRSWHALPPYELQWQIAERLSHALEGLSNSRNNPLATHLHRITPAVTDLGRLNPHSLVPLVRWLAGQPFETPNDRRTLLDIFDSMSAGTRNYPGEFRTPTNVARVLVEIAAPAAGDRVYDPCFGSAALLTAACDYVQRKEKDGFSRSAASPLRVFGVELNPNAYVIGLARLALAGIHDAQLELGNSLERTSGDAPQGDGFDVVIANPPWGMRSDPEGLDHFAVRTADIAGLFIQHALSQLRPGGRAVVVVPKGVLFRAGPEQSLRRMLLEQHTVEAVVALPDTAIMPHSKVSASILTLRRGGQTERIRMFDATDFFIEGMSGGAATARNEFAELLGEQLRSPQPSMHCWDVDAEVLAEVGWDFTSRRRDESRLFGILDSLVPEVEVLPLKESCNILTGLAIKSSDLLDEPVGEEPIPYVRIKDVKRGQAAKGSSWLSPDSASSVDAGLKLRAGDVLLSKSGTIGKPGVVRNAAVGAIAANGLFVLRPIQGRLDPHFLVAYLESSECRAWLRDNARGATIQHLSKRALEELPVPLPALQLQQFVAQIHSESNIDVLVFLAQLLTEGGRDLLAEWQDKLDQITPVENNAGNEVSDVSLLDQFATEIQPVSDQIIYGKYAQGSVAVWIPKFIEAISSLRGVRNLPRSPALLSVLQGSARALKDLIVRILGNSPDETKARNLSILVTNLLDQACLALLRDVKLVLSTDVSVLRPGETVEIQLHVDNKGPLPLRDLNITTSPDWGSARVSYLAENGRSTVELTGDGPKSAGPFMLDTRWSALRLDGQAVNGSQEIALDIVESDNRTVGNRVELGGSPYICGDPVKPDRNDVFFGREELIDQIRRQIMESGNVVLLEGNRRTGKSSILWHLEGPNAVPGWMGVYCNLQGAEGSHKGAGVPTAEVFRGIAYSIAQSLRNLDGAAPLPDGSILSPDRELGLVRAIREGISAESPFMDFRGYIEVALRKLETHELGLLLMLDEFDKLQEGIDSGVTSPQVPENIRFLIHQYPRLSAILTGSHIISRLKDEYWSALFGLGGLKVRVSFLPDNAARQLVVEPVRDRLVYSREAVDYVVHLTSGQPYLLQDLCNRAFALAAQLKTRSITIDLVKQASDLLIDGNTYFGSFWEFAGSDRRRLILALAQRESAGLDEFRFGVIQERLLNLGVEIDDEALIADLTELRNLELIKLIGESSGGHYVLTIPLLGTWIEKQQDFAMLISKARLETEDQHE